VTEAKGLVLVVDDDPDVRDVVSLALRESGFVVAEASNGEQVQQRLTEHTPDVILLDLGLPDVGGLDVLVDLTATSSTPVIVLSGRSGETDRVVGLDLGADDYIVKPFSSRELVARVAAALRRTSRQRPDPTAVFGDLLIDERTREVKVSGASVELTAKEFDLLAFLARSPRQVFSRSQILQSVWRSASEWQDDSTVAEHIYRLRRKLDPRDRERWIKTVRGVGYRFVQSDT
jgi:DNA-binding response OmpR family regulator